MTNAEQQFQDLLTRIRNGSAQAVALLIAQHADSIIRVIRRRLHQLMRSQFDSEDFTQIVWASFFTNLHRLSDFNDSGELRAFLSRVAQNKVVDAARRRMVLEKNNVNREQSIHEGSWKAEKDIPSNDPTPSQTVDKRDRWERYLNRLPERYREIIALRSAGFTMGEIADRIGVSERTVRRVLSNIADGNAQ